MGKIRFLYELKDRRGSLVHGCFDVLHVGHIRMLETARQLAEPLIVTLTADRFIRKGPGRPCFEEAIRAECVAALACVDYVAVVNEATALSAIQIIRPLYYVKGSEYELRGGISALERAEVARQGGTVVYTERFASSTSILERLVGT